jgi:hypothetical protein
VNTLDWAVALVVGRVEMVQEVTLQVLALVVKEIQVVQHHKVLVAEVELEQQVVHLQDKMVEQVVSVQLTIMPMVQMSTTQVAVAVAHLVMAVTDHLEVLVVLVAVQLELLQVAEHKHHLQLLTLVAVVAVDQHIKHQ